MKKSFFWGLLGLSLVFASCQKQEGPALTPSGILTVTIPQESVQTRAAADYGQGNHINRCILEVYRDDVKYKRYVTTVMGGTATFDNLQLVASQAYDFVFWADCGETDLADKHYNTTNLTNITVKDGYAGNNDEFDAFFHAEEMTVTDAFSKSVTLTRPFGQLNVKTNDMGVIGQEELKPTHVTVDFVEIPTSFNALTGEAGDPAAVSYNAAIVDQSAGELTVDYIWAAPVQANLADFSMTFLNGATEITTNDNFHNIPIRRNYKTSVSGNLLTKTGTLSVTIDPAFSDPGYDESIAEVEDIAAANAALAAGKTNVVVAEAPESEATILIPKIYTTGNDTRVSISLPATDQTVNFEYGSEDQNAPATVNVSIPTTTNVVINLPNSTVTLNGQTYQSVTASTADNTLIIPEGVVVDELTINKGNVEIYGTVGELQLNEGAGIVSVYSVGDAETLKRAAELVAAKKCAKIVLTADIDLQGSASNLWEPINTESSAFVEFDGAGHTISNLYVDNLTGHADGPGYYYGGFFYVLQGTVKNLTLEGANVTCYRGAALIGRMDYGTVENCTVKNATIHGFQKVGGIVGYVNGGGVQRDVTISGCTVDQCAVYTVAPERGLYQAGGLIGYLQTHERDVLIEGNSVSGISFDKVYESPADVADKVYDMEQYYSHAFIGDVVNVSSQSDAYDNYTVELRNNSVAEQVSGIPTCDRTDNYIGWWAGDYNVSGRPYSTKLIVDGEVKDRWIEVKRVAAQIEAGGDVTVYRNYDFTVMEDVIEITKPTVLNLRANVKVSAGVESVYLLNQSDLTINAAAGAAMNMTRRVVENHGTLTVEGGTYSTTVNNGGTAMWNNSTEAVMTLDSVTVNASFFAVAGSGQININGGTITSTSSNKYDSWAYCVRAQEGCTMVIENATIQGVQGALASIESSHVTVKNANISARNSEPGRQDAFYALYAASLGVIEVLDGEFYSDRTPCAYASDDDQAGAPLGGFVLKGGKYSSYPKNDDGSIWQPEAGYQYVETGDATYPYAIQPQ